VLSKGVCAGIVAIVTLLPAAPAAALEQRAYFSEIDSGSRITSATIQSDGTAAMTPGVSATAGALGIEGIAIAPDGGHLYAAVQDNKVYNYAIGGSGPLDFINSPDTDTRSFGVVTTPDGKHVYVASGDSAVYQLNVAASGALQPPAAQPLFVTHPTELAMAPDGDHLYAATESDMVVPYDVDPDGSITPGVGLPIDGSAFAVSITPDGKTLYVPEEFGSNLLHKYTIAADGSLTEQGTGTPIPDGGDTFGSTITPDGKFLYVANAVNGSVAAFRLGAGAPAALPGPPITNPALEHPTSMTTNASGTTLFVTDNTSPVTHRFSIAANGALTYEAPAIATGVQGDLQSVALTPDQPPVASFTTSINGRRVAFDGSGSSDPDSSVARYDWNFGDGGTLANGGPAPTHKYKGGPKPAVTLTVTDADGCSTRYVSAGQTPYCNGSPIARETRVPFQAKILGKRTQKLGSKVKLKASCPADCSIKVTGSLKLTGGDAKAAKLKGDKAKIDAGKSKTLKLKLSKKARGAAKDARKAIAKIKVKATDEAGDQDKQKLNIKLK
jgi:6-phosphogluconolactonase (cycloisomerase 2 family)